MNTLAFPELARFRFCFRAIEPLALPAYSGSAWRGLLGHGLRRTSCVTGAKSCEGCLLLHSCVYARLFESHGGSGDDPRFQRRPHPYALTLLEAGGRRLEEGERMAVELTLVGEAIDALPYLAQAMIQAGRLGMGREHGRFELDGVQQEAGLGSDQWRQLLDEETGRLLLSKPQPMEIPPPTAAAVLELQTPLRIKRRGKLLGPREFQASDFLRALWRRMQDIGRFYGDARQGVELGLPQTRADFFDGSAELRLHWKDWKRFSSRQKAAMQMGGVVGQIHLRGEALEEWWPLIWLGQWLHLGKATSMGLGQYRVVGRPGH